METTEGDKKDEQSLSVSVPKSSSYSPKISRPKLPTFNTRPVGHHGRAKTDPGRGAEIRAVLEDINNLKRVDFVKKYSRPKILQMHPPSIVHSHSSNTSPTTSPSVEERPSSFSRSRSRSLRLLTDKLKASKRGTSSEHKMGNTSTNQTTDDVTSFTEVPVEAFERASEVEHDSNESLSSDAVAEIKSADDGHESSSSSTHDSYNYETASEKGMVEDCIPEDIEKEKETYFSDDDEHNSSFTCSAGHESAEHDNLSRSSDKTSEDEGLCVGESESDSPPTTHISKYIYHPIDRNSQFLQLAATAPKRRTGIGGISLINKGRVPVLHKSGSAGEEPSRIEDYGHRHIHRLEIGAGGSTRKVMRFVTHPPQTKTAFREEGAIDSNGFGYLKSTSSAESPPIPGELGEETSEISLADSQMGESVHDSSYQDVVEGLVSETRNVDLQERKNGKILKQKSKSDPSGHKTKEPVDLPSVISSAQSYPLMRNESKEKREIVDLKVLEDSNNDDIQPMPSDSEKRQSLEASDSFDDECRSSHQNEYEDSFRGSMSTDGDDILMSPTIDSPSTSVSVICGGISAPSTPINQSPTNSIDRTQNYLNVPSSLKPIFRSASSVSVVTNRDKNYSVANKEKEFVRKHSLASAEDETPNDGNDFLPIGDPAALQATSMPNVRERTASESPEREIKDKRYHIVEELYRNEKEYVEALKTLKDKYMVPLKTQSSLDDMTVDNIFYMIPEILTHHSIYLDFLDNVWKNWDPHSSTVGNLIKNIFCKQTILNSYLSFVENYKTAGKVIENALQTKSSVQKFVEQCQKDSGSKLSMKDLIVRPIQRIPRYELLIQRLIHNTHRDHPDYPLLKSAEQTLHEFAMKIGTVNETQNEEDQQETLKKLEDLLMTDLAVPDRMYLRHDMVQILNKKDQCCIWMLSDLIILSSVKRKSGSVPRKVSIVLKSPAGQDYAENAKHKVWLRVALDDIEVVKSEGSLTRHSTLDKTQVEDDLHILNDINDLTSKLSCQHSGLEEIVKEMLISLNKQLEDHMLRYSDSNKMELLVTTQEGVHHYEITFVSAEKRSTWETSFLDAKQKLSLLTDKRAPEFLQPLQITKTRAGMQFSCASPIDGLNSDGYRDIWVCNSDGYVGHMCLLSLQPEPIVTLNTPVPGCNARILCISAVPAYSDLFRRRSSTKRQHKQQALVASIVEKPVINIEQVDNTIPEDDTVPEEGSQSESSSSDDDDDDEEMSFSQKHKKMLDDITVPRLPVSQYTESSPDPITQTGSWSQDSHKSAMWLGTEDGCIHIFQCTDNIKTTKNKLKIHHGSPVHAVIYLDNKVFVSLANGDLIVYKRDHEGLWDTEHPYTRSIGSVSCPINRMLPVAGKLWCGCHGSIRIINPLTLSTEVTFQVTSNANRCIQCIVSSGQGVWLATTQSSKIMLYHATTYDFLMDVSIAQAVAQKLHSADDIIRQHKAACLRITALMVCKDLLWVGTSAGVILTIPMPRITSMTTRGSLTVPGVTGLVFGHTGHVRFLTCIDMSNSTAQTKTDQSRYSDQNENIRNVQDLPRRASMAATMATFATRMLVISGGDGYEDFRTNVANESAGRDDSTNHLLLWQV